MRDINRIDSFCNEITKMWKNNVPDWRFGQLLINVFTYASDKTPLDIFYYEEEDILELFKDFFSQS